MDQLEVAAGLGGAGLALAALSFAVRELAKRASRLSVRPPAEPKIVDPSSSGFMRAMDARQTKAAEESAMRLQVYETHKIVTDRDIDGVPRVHNKRTVEEAILESRELDGRQVELLERLCELIEEALGKRSRPAHPEGRYRKKQQSHGRVDK